MNNNDFITNLSSLDLNENELDCIYELAAEYKKACKKHPDWPDDKIHACAIVAEESGELVRACLQHEYEGGLYNEMIKESIHTGAMAIRFLVNA